MRASDHRLKCHTVLSPRGASGNSCELRSEVAIAVCLIGKANAWGSCRVRAFLETPLDAPCFASV